MSFIQRAIDLTFTLEKKTFSDSGTNTLKLSGLRVSARISNAGENGYCEAHVTVWGMTLSQMNDLSTLGVQVQFVPRNKLVVEAGDVGTTLTKVFDGNILAAYIDMSAPPQVGLQVIGMGLYADAIAPAKANSYPDSTDVGKICTLLCGTMGVPFTNNGVNVSLYRPYLWGPLRQQLVQVIQSAGIGWNGGEGGQVTIWPKNGSNGKASVLISRATGMVRSPSYTPTGLVVQSLFNPLVLMGSELEVESEVLQIPPGKWRVSNSQHNLDAQIPRGEWFSTYYTTWPDSVAVK
jgi:hypothetical protein